MHYYKNIFNDRTSYTKHLAYFIFQNANDNKLPGYSEAGLIRYYLNTTYITANNVG